MERFWFFSRNLKRLPRQLEFRVLLDVYESCIGMCCMVATVCRESKQGRFRVIGWELQGDAVAKQGACKGGRQGSALFVP